MPICQRCLSAIGDVYPQGPDTRSVKVVKIHYPVFTQCDIHGCWVCFKLSKWVESGHPNLFKSWKMKPLGVKFFHHANIAVPKQANFPMRLFVGIGLNYKNSDDNKFCILDLTLILPGELAVRLGARHTVPQPGSFDFSILQKWVDRCRKCHKQCNEKKPNWYPSRLLHITSGGQQVRLVISQDHAPKGQYMTLSHRWGNFRYTNLMTTTMADLQRAITVSDLPPAFQDSIKIAVFLNIQYLWIDALCIKQDLDRSDWNIECLTMGKVYANAFLNISATLAVDGSETLFHNQGCDSLSPSEIKFKIKGKTKHFYLLDGDIWTDEISNAPLNSRGWVFQERFLARRVLHFGTRQLGWECRQLTALEMFPRGLPTNLGSPVAKSSLHAQLSKAARHTRRSSVQDWLSIWHHIVETYSQCHFTFVEDKIVAFAGIGASISDFVDTELVAGMLEKSLLYDLAWCRGIEDRESSPLRDDFLRAPSWSWMSVDGQINFPWDISGVRRVRTYVENIEILREHGDLCGTNSRLRLKGVCMQLRPKWFKDLIVGFSLSDLPACNFTVEDSTRGSSIYGEVAIEKMQNLAERNRILLLPLFSTPYFFNGILITRNRGAGLYRRIGAIQIPVMVESVDDMEKKPGEENTVMDDWVRDTRVTDKNFTKFYNYAASRLDGYIQSSVNECIEIL